ncbi:MAG: DNA polymerase III subunit gamma/tau [Alkaliphilus sp.]|nr:DNA polymerase III subunit gamma/tau [Alkaliphilus sp.]
MSYETLYRKWRPKVFEDIIGQEETVTILKNQIRYSNIAHAYLFTGIRGTGKTSTARIFARAVNCINPKDANPCNECEICRSILTESSMDVIEIDAASNRGIESIRELREHTKYNPSSSKYKIYIIDEAHMLTEHAANALLKTLEEPPSHVIFILATTEPYKMEATILSRCQKFDFKPVKIKDIVKQLSFICKEEQIDYEEEALRLIALNSEGALRDALSILDRCISFNNETLKYDDVINILGAVNYEVMFNLVKSIGEQSTSDALMLVNEIFAGGKDPGQLMKDLISHLRSLLFVKIDVKIDELLSLPEERLRQFKEQSKLFNINQVSSFIYTLSDIESRLKYSSQPRILMEIAVASLCNRELNNSLEGIIERVKHLEKIIASGEIDARRKGEETQDYKAEKVRDTGTDFTAQKPEEEKDLRGKEKSKDDNRVFNTIKNVWGQVLDQMLKDKKASVKSLLENGILKDLNKSILIISFKEEFGVLCNMLDKEETKEYISDTILKITGQNVRPSFVIEDQTIMADGIGEQNEQKEQEKDIVELFKEVLPREIFDILEIIDG